MSVGTIHTFVGHGNGNRIRATASYAGVQLDLAEGYQHGVTNKTPEYIAKFGPGKVPAFEGKDGFLLFETSAIAKYIASLAPNSGLLGSTPKDLALIDQWVSYVDSEIYAHLRALNGLLRGTPPYFKPTDLHLRQLAERGFAVVDKHLQTRTFLIGHRITLADITLAQVGALGFRTVIGTAERAKIPNVVRHFNAVWGHSKIKAIVGEPEFVDKPVQYVPPAKPAKAAPAPAAPKEKAAPKPKPAKEEDDDEPLVPEEPKAKNPLDDLPKSTLNLEDWKRAYSNLDTRGPGGSLEWFYEKYDPAGYSLWKVAFKYPEELTQTFMSANQIGGFFNRLEASRKYLFGSVGVLGTSNNSTIEGVLIARGSDIKPVVDCAPDWESYAYEKIDLSNAEQKSYFEGALAWDLESGGKKWADGKNFK